MAKKIYEEANIQAIADKIREKTGGTATYKTSEMPTGVDEVYDTGYNEGFKISSGEIAMDSMRTEDGSEGWYCTVNENDYSYTPAGSLINDTYVCYHAVVSVGETYKVICTPMNPNNLWENFFLCVGDPYSGMLAVQANDESLGQYVKKVDGTTYMITVPENCTNIHINCAIADGCKMYLSTDYGIGYDTGFTEGVASVPTPEGTIEIAENGSFDVTQYAEANVNVPVPEGYIQPTGAIDITENGEHDVAEFEKVNVNVESSGSDETAAMLTGLINRTATEISDDTVESIGEYVFSGLYSLVNVNFPKVKTIGSNAFYNCNSLALTELPIGLTSIGNDAFYNCKKLALTELPSGVTSIGKYAFYSCPNLALTELPSGVTRILEYTFSKCTNLALTELPSGLTVIGASAFNQCVNLSLTKIPYGVLTVASSSFAYCTGLKSITFEGTPTTIVGSPFNNCTNLTEINVPWAEGEVGGAPWGATNATINYNYTEG